MRLSNHFIRIIEDTTIQEPVKRFTILVIDPSGQYHRLNERDLNSDVFEEVMRLHAIHLESTSNSNSSEKQSESIKLQYPDFEIDVDKKSPLLILLLMKRLITFDDIRRWLKIEKNSFITTMSIIPQCIMKFLEPSDRLKLLMTSCLVEYATIVAERCLKKPATRIVFLLDVTGSQQPNIRNIIAKLSDFLTQVNKLYKGSDTKIKIIGYRDIHNPDTLTCETDWFQAKQESVLPIINLLQQPIFACKDGADFAEHPAAALRKLQHEMLQMEQQTKVIAFLISDAPPHGAEHLLACDSGGDDFPDCTTRDGTKIDNAFDVLKDLNKVAKKIKLNFTLNCAITGGNTYSIQIGQMFALMTGGKCMELNESSDLTSLISGSMKEQQDINQLGTLVARHAAAEAAKQGKTVKELTEKDYTMLVKKLNVADKKITIIKGGSAIPRLVREVSQATDSSHASKVALQLRQASAPASKTYAGSGISGIKPPSLSHSGSIMFTMDRFNSSDFADSYSSSSKSATDTDTYTFPPPHPSLSRSVSHAVTSSVSDSLRNPSSIRQLSQVVLGCLNESDSEEDKTLNSTSKTLKARGL